MQFEEQLFDPKNQKPIELTRKWAAEMTREAGVYAIFEGSEIRYVGESGSLRARMNDLLSTLNHVVRRNIGAHKYSDHPKYQKATTRKKFDPEIEALVEAFLQTEHKIAFLEIKLGRKELEEWLIRFHKPMYNKKGQRSSRKTRWEKWQDDIREMEL